MLLTDFALTRGRVTLIAALALALAGVSYFFGLPREEDPEFTLRTATVTTAFPGANAERVEELVTAPLEEAVREIPEIDNVTSVSMNGVSIVTVNLREEYYDLDPIWDDLRKRVDAATSDLPNGIYGPDVNDDFGEVFGIVVALSGDGFTPAELEDEADALKEKLLQNSEVSSVEIYGAPERQVFVEYDVDTLRQYNLTATSLRQILGGINIVSPGGQIDTGTETIVIEPSGNIETAQDLRETLITLPGSSQAVFLGDIVDVREGYEDADSYVHTDARTETCVRSGEAACRRGVAVAIAMRDGGNISTLAVQVTNTVTAFENQAPRGLEAQFIAFQPDRVDQSVDDFVGNLMQSIVIVLVVMLITLGLRTGVVVATLIPMAIAMTFLLMAITGEAMHQISLAALIIALGLLVDNAIVVTEAIQVGIDEGKPPRQAALDACGELWFGLLSATITTAAAFLPLALADSMMGEFLSSLFSVLVMALASSWLLAMTLIPYLAVVLIRRNKKVAARAEAGEVEKTPPVYVAYRKVLQAAMRLRWVTLVGAVVAIGASLTLLGSVPVIFFNSEPKDYFTIDVELPRGTDLAETERVVAGIEDFVATELAGDQGAVTTWMSFVGNGGPRFVLNVTPADGGSHYAMFFVNADGNQHEAERAKLANYLASLPGVEATINTPGAGPTSKYPVRVRLGGDTIESVSQAGADVRRALLAIEGVTAVTDDWGVRTKSLGVAIDPVAASAAGVSNEEIANTLTATYEGIETTELRQGEDVIPVIMRGKRETRGDLGSVERVNLLAPNSGSLVPVASVAQVSMDLGVSKIARRDGKRTITVSAMVDASVTTANAVTTELEGWLGDEAAFSPDIGWELGGDAEDQAKSMGSIAAGLPLAGFIILLTLVLQFNSVRRTVIVLATVPLGLIGVSIGLFVMNSSLGFMAFLGVISLAGIVINNAIVLLERIQVEIDDGRHPWDAIVEAAQRRTRPILLTTLTTCGGLIPLYLGGGAMWQPMAVTIMGGLIFSTILTLVVIPVLYATLFRVHPPTLGPAFAAVGGGSMGGGSMAEASVVMPTQTAGAEETDLGSAVEASGSVLGSTSLETPAARADAEPDADAAEDEADDVRP